MRVAQVIASLDIGGAEMMLAGVVRSLQGTGVEPLVVTLNGAGPLADVVAAAGAPVHAMGMRPTAPDPRLVLRLRDLFRAQSVDVVQTWMYHSDLVGGVAATMAGVPVVWNLQASVLPQRKWSTLAVRRACARLSRRIPREIICCAESAREAHRALGYDDDRMVVIRNACDTAVFRPDQSARQTIRAELGIEQATPLVGMMARADPGKGHAVLARAAALVARLQPDLELVLAGDGVDRANTDLVTMLRDAGVEERCHLLGPRRDVARLDAALDVFVLPSMAEGLPLAVTEAMACGVPCVVSDVGECRDLVDGVGRVVPPGDVDQLAGAIGDVLALPAVRRAELGAAARARVEADYSLAVSVAGYIDSWTRVRNAHQRGRDAGVAVQAR